jgi:N2,N2-dimethylguanosine tRNA methyltransferase
MKYLAENHTSFGTFDRMTGMLTVMMEELETPLYYVLSHICGVLHISTPPLSAVMYLRLRLDLPSPMLAILSLSLIASHKQSKPKPRQKFCGMFCELYINRRTEKSRIPSHLPQLSSPRNLNQLTLLLVMLCLNQLMKSRQ